MRQSSAKQPSVRIPIPSFVNEDLENGNDSPEDSESDESTLSFTDASMYSNFARRSYRKYNPNLDSSNSEEDFLTDASMNSRKYKKKAKTPFQKGRNKIEKPVDIKKLPKKESLQQVGPQSKEEFVKHYLDRQEEWGTEDIDDLLSIKSHPTSKQKPISSLDLHLG